MVVHVIDDLMQLVLRSFSVVEAEVVAIDATVS